MLKRPLVELAGSDTLEEAVERTLASYPDPDVRQAWARNGNWRPEVHAERLEDETDPQVLTWLLTPTCAVAEDVLTRLCGHEDLSVSLKAALHPSTPDPAAAAAVRRARSSSKGKTEHLLVGLRMKGAAGKDETLRELVSHLDPGVATSVAEHCTHESTQRALLRRVRSLNTANETNANLLRAAGKVQWVPTLLAEWERTLSRLPEDLRNVVPRVDPEKVARAAAARAAAVEAAREGERRVAEIRRRASDPSEHARILQEVEASLKERNVELTWKLARSAFESGKWSVEDALKLVNRSEQAQRGEMLKTLAARPLTTLERANVLEAASKLSHTKDAHTLTHLVQADTHGALAATQHLNPRVTGSVLVAVAGSRSAAPDELAQTIQLSKDGTETGRQVQRAIMTNPHAPVSVLALLPAKVVLQDRKCASRITLWAVENLSAGELELFVALCENPQGSVTDLLDAARNALR